MSFLKDYAENQKTLSDFIANRSPVLLGLGIAGVLHGANPGANTVQVDAAELLANHTWTHRVFELKVHIDSPRPGRLTLGRTTTKTDITINDFTVSREQCAFVIEKGGVVISDIGSRNGTLVGTMRLTKPQRLNLKGGEIITLGRLQFQFLTADAFLIAVKSFKPDLVG